MASGAGAVGGVDSDCEEEPEDPSSHFNDGAEVAGALDGLSLQDDTQNREEEDELSLFRQQWRRELESTATPQNVTVPEPEAEPQTDEEKAKKLFLQGVEMERGGKLYEAIQHYKRAMQILPDVESRLYEASDVREDTPEEEERILEEKPRENRAEESEDEDAVEGEDLYSRLQRIMARKGAFIEPELPVKGGHLSWLPYEVLIVVLRWVVGAELDAASLERVSGVCRAMYLAARDQDLWRAICLRTWGIECGTPRSTGFPSWRDMYISRPRLRLDGCYISKTTYLRHGENSFQDQFYRPWYIVDYYRYLRFFPDGVVLSWTTAEEPAACVGQLRTRTPRHGLGVVAGNYRLSGDKVVIVLKKTNSEKKQVQATNTRFRSRRKDSHEHHEQTFHMELELRGSRCGPNSQLRWRGYWVCGRRGQRAPLELAGARYPALAFSRVAAYTAHAAAPLAPYTR